MQIISGKKASFIKKKCLIGGAYFAIKLVLLPPVLNRFN